MNSSLRQHWVAILVTTLVTFVASVALTVLQPMEYRSSFTILAIDNDPNLDGYAAAKSAERLSQSLSRTLMTTAFADQVYQQLKDRPEVKDNQIISTDLQTRRDEWKKRITAQAFPDVGQVKVSVYQRERLQADTVSNAVSLIVTANGSAYLGGGQNVLLKIVDTPLTSKTPVRPNVFANLVIGLILGFAGSIAYFLLFAAPKTQPIPMFIGSVAPAMLPSTPTPTATTPDLERLQRLESQVLASANTDREKPNPRSKEPALHVPSPRPSQVSHPKTSSPENLPIIDEIVMP